MIENRKLTKNIFLNVQSYFLLQDEFPYKNSSIRIIPSFQETSPTVGLTVQIIFQRMDNFLFDRMKIFSRFSWNSLKRKKGCVFESNRKWTIKEIQFSRGIWKKNEHFVEQKLRKKRTDLHTVTFWIFASVITTLTRYIYFAYTGMKIALIIDKVALSIK